MVPEIWTGPVWAAAAVALSDAAINAKITRNIIGATPYRSGLRPSGQHLYLILEH